MALGLMRAAGVALAVNLVCSSAILPAAAASRAGCFRPAEIEAEQAMQYQTELMVLSDTCRSETYRRFTVRNRALIVDYQQRMIDHFRRGGARSAETAFDSYQTRLANELSLNTGREPVAALCSRSAGFLAEADELSEEQFRQHVAALAAKRSSDYPRCAN